MKHHPDCEFWLDNYANECSCGLTAPRPAWSALEPVTDAAWAEWAARVRQAHDWSALSHNLICYTCGTHILGAGPECTPSAAEPEHAEAALAAYLADLDEGPELRGVEACRAWGAA